ncbi:TetR family transcriptional regulator [Streptomyces sp. 3MP-14]|uniref:TetR family transcriptional regulator n=1 Tax=Streptomyces mimosae TaxID=2586635 RepID=A0A5N6ABA5_9ACTN|nr:MULTISPECIES: TetR/AcrR family transcriptional regulator C-terminal domain-containing protein [Streptomyces]KAB8165313.1 TetR family transcriptional regulator [Streptomyces mimosae]KAB8175945.1 TetR family transcriptional regulator [Streptomyces sp. 3MP-14]
MAPRTRRTERRAEALSRERIVEAAVELLDSAGERGLTFRTLTERLATGPGAIYWHVANKGELLDAATDAVLAAALTPTPGRADAADAADAPRAEIHAVALGLFDTIDAHPWLAGRIAAQLSLSPWRSVAPRVLEALGRQVAALGVPEAHWFTATSALMHYILGAAGLNAANARTAAPETDRGAVLDATSRAWKELDAGAYPFTRAVADQMRTHDDRAEFLAGLDLVLAGIAARYPPAER